eukprot:1160788-Pelagomonas_calceolata.AAC.10
MAMVCTAIPIIISYNQPSKHQFEVGMACTAISHLLPSNGTLMVYLLQQPSKHLLEVARMCTASMVKGTGVHCCSTCYHHLL